MADNLDGNNDLIIGADGQIKSVDSPVFDIRHGQAGAEQGTADTLHPVTPNAILLAPARMPTPAAPVIPPAQTDTVTAQPPKIPALRADLMPHITAAAQPQPVIRPVQMPPPGATEVGRETIQIAPHPTTNRFPWASVDNPTVSVYQTPLPEPAPVAPLPAEPEPQSVPEPEPPALPILPAPVEPPEPPVAEPVAPAPTEAPVIEPPVAVAPAMPTEPVPVPETAPIAEATPPPAPVAPAVTAADSTPLPQPKPVHHFSPFHSLYSHYTREVWKVLRPVKSLRILRVVALLIILVVLVTIWLSNGAPTDVYQLPILRNLIVR